LILIDTTIWSLALRRRGRDLNAGERRHVAEWERLVREGGAVLIVQSVRSCSPGCATSGRGSASG
jgi:hypothetical protein